MTTIPPQSIVRVLLVDDAPEDRVAFRRLLTKTDDISFEVSEAGNVAQAKAMLEKTRPDCVLLDYDLPDGNGLELLRAIVAKWGVHAFGIVMLTGSAATVVAVEALQSGAHDFILKGNVHGVLLQQSVRNAIEKAAIHRELESKRKELARKNTELETHVVQLEREMAERRRAELALKDSETFLQSVVGASTDCIKVLDLDGRVLWMSDTGLRLMEIDDFTPYRNADWATFWAYEGKEEQARAVVAAACEGKVGRLYGCFPTIVSRKVRWWDVQVSPINGRNGKPERILAVSRDVTDARAADEALRESEARLNLAAIAADLGPWTWDAASDIVNFSERGAEIFGIPAGPSVTWTQLRELLHEEDRETARKAVEESVSSRGEYAIEYRVNRSDGKMVWIAATGRGQYDAEGRVVGMVGVVQDITARKNAERATRQLAAIVESSDDAVVSKNLDGVVQTWNAGAARLFGYSAQEMIGRSITILLPHGQLDEEARILARIRKGEPIEHYETVRRRKDGQLIDVSLTVSPIRDSRGVIVGASKIARDISRRKATESALTRRTHTLEVLNRVGEALVAERDVEKIVQSVTDAAREITGAKFGAFFYNTVNEQGESYTLYTLSGVSRDAFANFPMPRNTEVFGPTFRGEGTIRVGDILADPRYGKNAPNKGMPAGHLPVRSYLAAPVRSGSGEIIGGLFFGHPEADVFTEEAEDVLEALAAQAAIAIDNARLYRAVQRELADHKRAREEVRAREQQLRLVTNNAPVFLLQCDREYRYTFANLPYAARYGFTPETLMGKTVWEVTGRAAFNAARHHIDAALAGERVEFEMEIPYDHLGTRWVHVIFVPDRNPAGEVAGFVGVLTDITQRKSAELELERARDEALAGSRAKDDFLAALSHELRTPLNPVLLLASDAAEDPKLSADVRESFETIRRQVNLEARLIDDLLDLTRITRGKLSLDRRIVDAHEVLTDAIETVRPELEGKNLLFELEMRASLHAVFGDAVRLQQVFWNVLKNAVKFTDEDGRISVTTSVNPGNRRLRIEVKDTGHGLTAQELARIFEAFSQGEHAAAGGSHRFGGLGLGLAISRSIVEMHGGDIYAESEGRNRGATFIIELPLMSVTTTHDQNPQTENGTTTGTNPSFAKRGRLLVIEDHTPTRNTLKSLLERRSFEVLTAGSAVEARELARQQPPDLVISDIGLPDADGCTLMKEFRETNPALPGIALSGYGMDEDLARTREAGFVEHLTKPVNVGALERAIEKIFSTKS
ncbi:MAG: PAS domain S-box protein [Nibricoccus sp.]